VATNETTFPQSTLDFSTGPKKPNPDTVYGNVSGDFYYLACVRAEIEDAITVATESPEVANIAFATSAATNIVYDASDPGAKFYLSGKGVEIPEGKYGPDNLLRLSQLDQYDELRGIANPSDSSDPVGQGRNNLLAMLSETDYSVLAGYQDMIAMVNKSIDVYITRVQNFKSYTAAEKKRSIQALEGLRTSLPLTIHANCFAKNTSIDHLFLDNVSVKATAGAKLLDSSPTYYQADSMSRRRPRSDFFTVEMITPSLDGTEPRRVDLEAAEGRIVTSLQLNMSPASLVINAAKKTNRYQTLVRWVEEHWGDEMDQISFSGTSYAFIDFKTDGGQGLCVNSRNISEPYKELQHLVDLYTTNGIVYQDKEIPLKRDPDTGLLTPLIQRRTFFNMGDPANPYTVGNHPRAGMANYRLYIRMRCYFAEFIGYFESFDVTESSDKPFSLSYNVSFRAEHTKWL